MDWKIMVNLIGEQVQPNLLPVLMLKPQKVMNFYTGLTEGVCWRLTQFLENSRIDVENKKIEDPYNSVEVYERIMEAVGDESSVVLNITGGTKLMMLGAVRVAEEGEFSMAYLISEKVPEKLVLYHGGFEFKEVKEVPELLTLDSFLKVQLGEYSIEEPVEPFEIAIESLLMDWQREGFIGEYFPNVDLAKGTGVRKPDFIVRCRNRIGVFEVKSGKRAISSVGINQLNSWTQRENLGVYTVKFLVVDRVFDDEALKETAKFTRINIVELPGFGDSGRISEEERENFKKILKNSALKCGLS